MAKKNETIVEPICTLCLHAIGWDWGLCDAFPDGIPEEILEGKFDHTKSYKKGDVHDYGITYKGVGG